MIRFTLSFADLLVVTGNTLSKFKVVYSAEELLWRHLMKIGRFPVVSGMHV